MPVATLVFKSRISPFSPFLAFGRPFWSRIHARIPGCGQHGRKEKTVCPPPSLAYGCRFSTKAPAVHLERVRPWVECGVRHLHVHCHGHHTHADKRHIHTEFCRCRIDAQTMRRSQWEKGMRFWLLDVRRVGWEN